MGLLKVFKKSSEKEYNTKPIKKDDILKSDDDYEQWLDYISKGGTTEEWESLKDILDCEFTDESNIEFLTYQKELRPVFDEYSQLLSLLNNDWSILYNSKDYTSDFANVVENELYKSINLYKQIRTIDLKYDKDTMSGSKSFSRLPSLYERQGKYEKAIEACKIACSLDVDETKRMKRLIKKLKREPSFDEQNLIAKFEKSNESSENKEERNIRIENERQKLSAETIDLNQRKEASKQYRNKLYEKYFKNYPEMPFISLDRELNTNWEEQVTMFPNMIISKQMMTRYENGLLPGHIYMMYWIDKYKYKRRIPAYFEYKYGIEFEKEKKYLIKNRYLDKQGLPTELGLEEIEKHFEIIRSH